MTKSGTSNKEKSTEKEETEEGSGTFGGKYYVSRPLLINAIVLVPEAMKIGRRDGKYEKAARRKWRKGGRAVGTRSKLKMMC